jgi:diguanylate cyclase (GGDEF)-like protein/putative nucleotidyltransferase with HDIG domain
VFGSRPQVRRPVLLILVYGVFLALVGITASAQAVLVSAHFRVATLNDTVGSDSATVRAFVNAYVQLRYLDGTAGGATSVELARLEEQLRTLPRAAEILRVELRRPDGTIVASNDSSLRGRTMSSTADFALAADGHAQAAIVDAAVSDAGPGNLGTANVLREFLPVQTAGRTVAVVGIWRDAVPILTRLEDVSRNVVLVTVSAGLIAAALLFLIFRSAQGRLTRQTEALLESVHRDPLTGAPNHGALVAHLAREIEAARSAGTVLGVALLDIDNFRLLNDNHGHRAGDDALLAVVDLLRRHLPESIVMGRYGPDEFLLVAGPAAVAGLEPAIDRVRVALADLSLQFDATERLPLTLSAGVCTFPEHGDSVTVLLAAAARTVGEAKASGGDTVRIASVGQGADATTSGFDVLQGLVNAVDTKDRYTKRHSEDVARYAAFLAERLGLDPETTGTIRVAGLLHDVGKIGIPDPILRKPGKLSADEQVIVKQHVALGHMIVRDVPDTDLVRAGIRHHHERWDGAGYLDGLGGEEIPLIARILAVADAFSAMTTTRPYRKALAIEEALTRLGDAAGSQLDERLVRVFLDGIETAADPPLPAEPGRRPLWTPRRRVA